MMIVWGVARCFRDTSRKTFFNYNEHFTIEASSFLCGKDAYSSENFVWNVSKRDIHHFDTILSII